MTTWTADDDHAAQTEGWCVSETTVGPMEIERVRGFDTVSDNMQPFTSDAEAIAHVYWLASEGSALHRKAMAFTLRFTDNPED